MTVRNLLIVNSVLAAISGLGLLLVPDQYVSPFGITLDGTAALFARAYGTGLLGVAIMTWQLRGLGREAHSAGTMGALVGWLTFTVLMVTGVMSGVAGGVATFWIVLGAVMTLAFAGAIAGVGFKEDARA